MRRRAGELMDANYALALEKLSRGEPLTPELVEFHLFRNFVAAQERYQMEPYAGPLVLFRATQDADMQYLGAGKTLGWSRHVQGAIRVRDVAGSHASMMLEPGVSQLIKALAKELALLDKTSAHTRSQAA